MAEKKQKISNSKAKYKASNPKQFAEMYNDAMPKYDDLCEGLAVELNVKNKTVKDWLDNKIIIKEI